MSGGAESVERGLLKTILNSDLRDVVKDSGEVLFESLLVDGVLKEIPVVRSVVGVVKTGLNVRDQLFLIKVMKFLRPLSKYTFGVALLESIQALTADYGSTLQARCVCSPPRPPLNT
jgi:hypothetical protein